MSSGRSIQASEWAGHTVAHPAGIAILGLMLLIVLFAKKEKVVLAILFMIVAIPSAQRIVIVSLDFSFIRILLLFALVRMFMKHEHKRIKYLKSDKLIFLWMIWSIIAYGIYYGEVGAIITRTGYMVDAVCAYIIGRVYVRSWEDMRRVILFFAYVSIPIAVFFMVERASGKNIFSMLGGVPEYTLIRDERLRCQGPFLHPIMAGLFWASILPWMAVAWKNQLINKKLLITSLICILLIIANTASSTPVVAVLFAIGGMYMMPFRRNLRLIRWGFLFMLLSLHMVMKKPVWHLISRFDLAGGSTGYHRYLLIDKAITYFPEWALFGTSSTAHWGHGLIDVTNQYVLEGISSGIIGLILFILFLWSIFKITGIAINKAVSHNERWLMWSSGVVLFVHAISFISASYFGQMISFLYICFGIIVSLSNDVLQREKNKHFNINKG